MKNIIKLLDKLDIKVYGEESHSKYHFLKLYGDESGYIENTYGDELFYFQSLEELIKKLKERLKK